ncbi:hypothetical protein DFQ26_009459 [Actinomortierella ambigua]|nr:hypothetical protein DFQ26_009459 [Actinomortierella ambigua]
MSLCILFLPKFWDIWKQRHKSTWEFTTDPIVGEGGNRSGSGLGGVLGGTVGPVAPHPADESRIDRTNPSTVRKNSLSIWADELLQRRWHQTSSQPSATGADSTSFMGEAGAEQRNAQRQRQQQQQQQQQQPSSREDLGDIPVQMESTPRSSIRGAVGGGVAIVDEGSQLKGRSDRELFLLRMQGLSKVKSYTTEDPLGVGQNRQDTPVTPVQLPARDLGAPQRLFLLPIMAQRNRISNFLSHWAMTTIILTPEAHAFLAVDSTSGNPKSILIKSMVPDYNESMPSLRIESIRSGMLLVRFPTVASLRGWMGLFSQQDIQALTPHGDQASVPWPQLGVSSHETDITVAGGLLGGGGGGGGLGGDDPMGGGGGGMGRFGLVGDPRASSAMVARRTAEQREMTGLGRLAPITGLTKVEASTLEEQLADSESLSTGVQPARSRSTSFFSRLGSSFSSGASRLWPSRKESAGSFWLGGSVLSRNSQDATATANPNATDTATTVNQMVHLGIGPLDRPKDTTPIWPTTPESAQHSPSLPVTNHAALRSLSDVREGADGGDVGVDMSRTDINPSDDGGGSWTGSDSTRYDRHLASIPGLQLTAPHQPPSTVVEEDLGNGSISSAKNVGDLTLKTPSAEMAPIQEMHTSLDRVDSRERKSSAEVARPPSARPIQPSLTPKDDKVSDVNSQDSMAIGQLPSGSSRDTSAEDRIAIEHSGDARPQSPAAPPPAESSGLPSATSLSSDRAQNNPSLSNVLQGRPHLAEVMSAFGMRHELHDEDDSEDDLYDPEFGIGPGSGRRRRRRPRRRIVPNNARDNRSRNTLGVPIGSGGGGRGGSVSSGPDQGQPSISRASTTTTTTSLSTPPGSAGTSWDNNMPNALSEEAEQLPPAIARIPSQAVLSVAAAAVSAGWSERDALSAAIVWDERRVWDQSPPLPLQPPPPTAPTSQQRRRPSLAWGIATSGRVSTHAASSLRRSKPKSSA